MLWRRKKEVDELTHFHFHGWRLIFHDKLMWEFPRELLVVLRFSTLLIIKAWRGENSCNLLFMVNFWYESYYKEGDESTDNIINNLNKELINFHLIERLNFISTSQVHSFTPNWVHWWMWYQINWAFISHQLKREFSVCNVPFTARKLSFILSFLFSVTNSSSFNSQVDIEWWERVTQKA